MQIRTKNFKAPYIAQLCAKYDCRLINTNRNYLVHSVNEGFQFGCTAAILGIFAREKPAVKIMIGYFYAESLILAEAGAQIGAIQIAGTTPQLSSRSSSRLRLHP
ncbi:MAG: DUF6754 domain-containing protein, partial [Bacillota bacterium]